MNSVELLAPAGSSEAFEAALAAGADAVYCGGPLFGARAYADNFSGDDLIRAIHTAHLHGKKLYLTVNTLLKNREMSEQLYDMLAPLYCVGLDAVIVQDLGVFRFIRRNFPGLSLHASTQMTVTGPYGMKFLEEEGADRVVAARECSLLEISRMHQASPIEIEAFVHGALCYSFSGQCLMSSLLGGRSGNRGRCAQPCRLPYQTADSSHKYKKSKEVCPLSLKDICTLDLLPEIISAGVVSLKIEGRMKQSGYTAGVTAMYRKYLDLYEKDPDHYQVSEADRRYLLDIFNRGGSCSGYFNQKNGPSMVSLHNDRKSSVEPGIPSALHKTINGKLVLIPEREAELTFSDPETDMSVTVTHGLVQKAAARPMSEERICAQISKLGNTDFTLGSLIIEMQGEIFVPVRVLNELRRKAAEALGSAITDRYKRELPAVRFDCPAKPGISTEPSLYASCETAEQARIIADIDDIKGLYVNYSGLKQIFDDTRFKNKELYLMLPYIMRGDAPKEIEKQCIEWANKGLHGFLVRNLEEYGWLKRLGLGHMAVADTGLYTWNNESAAFWDEHHILRITAPLELNSKELKHRFNNSSELIIYGYLPMMISAQCVRKTMLSCDKKEDFMYLKDRYDKEFRSVCVCNPWKTGNTKEDGFCYNIIYNCIPLGLINEQEPVRALGMHSLRLSFTFETAKETRRTAEEFCDVYFHHGKPGEHTFTKGHFKRGVE